MPPGATPPACVWPPLAEPYATALREAVDYVFSRWPPVGIVAAGTIIGGSPGPSSDLDLYVIHRAPYRQRVQRFFNGVPAEMFVNPPERVERQFAQDRREGRLVSAHMLATGAVVYASDPVVERLRRLAAAELNSQPEPSRGALNQRRYAAATSLEDAADVAEADPALCALILHRAVDAAITCRFWLAPAWQPRGKATLSALAKLDPPLADLARAFYVAAGLTQRRALAREIVQRVTRETGFFEWESAPEPV
ncbi:MAG TPA: hypothetical protein VFN74_09945 [Chloroflexota bacterium]|nr:hypothetical protein [Chloroflexota bacterium]